MKATFKIDTATQDQDYVGEESNRAESCLITFTTSQELVAELLLDGSELELA